MEGLSLPPQDAQTGQAHTEPQDLPDYSALLQEWKGFAFTWLLNPYLLPSTSPFHCQVLEAEPQRSEPGAHGHESSHLCPLGCPGAEPSTDNQISHTPFWRIRIMIFFFHSFLSTQHFFFHQKRKRCDTSALGIVTSGHEPPVFFFPAETLP